MKTGRVPLRMCIVCKQRNPKEKLIRMVKSKDFEIYIDKDCKKPGRGIYICKNILCIDKLKKAKRFEKGFNLIKVDEFYSKLYSLMEEVCNG